MAFSIDHTPLIIGRSGKGGFVDTRMSREHVRFSATNGVLRVADLESKNGMFLMGKRVDGDYFPANAVLRAGDTLLVCDEEPDPRVYPSASAVADTGVGEFVGSSHAASLIRRWIATVAPSADPALILGPTGTGKEVIARALHRLSGRSGPFVPVNCAAISPQIADAELFGHARGAFTGAEVARDGLFRSAHRGTLFLDEIGDLPADIQVKLLRAIEDHAVRPVGDSATKPIDVRLVAATNADLDSGAFRADLRARLATWTVTLPPLAARRADVLPLARYFAGGEQDAGAAPGWSADFAEALLLHDWPANVRELQRIVRRAARLADTAGTFELTQLPVELQERILERDRDGSDSPGREQIEDVLRRTRGNIVQAAAELGRDRAQVYRWLRRFGIEPDSFR